MQGYHGIAQGGHLTGLLSTVRGMMAPGDAEPSQKAAAMGPPSTPKASAEKVLCVQVARMQGTLSGKLGNVLPA